jgi:hypothetical protein
MQYESATARHHEQKLFLKRIDSGHACGRNVSLKVEHQRATTGNTWRRSACSIAFELEKE